MSGVKRCQIKKLQFARKLSHVIMICHSVSSIFDVIASAHGCHVRKLASELVRLANVEANWMNHRVFNIRCMHKKIIPQSLRMRPPDNTSASARVALHASKVFLQQRLHNSCNALAATRMRASALKSRLQAVLSPEEYRQLLEKHSEVLTTQAERVKKRHP